MKLICLQEKLKTSLNIAQNIVGKNLTLPILNNLLLKTETGRLKISSTNLEIGINTWTSGKIEKQGQITVAAKTLSDFVNNLPNKKIVIELKKDLLNLRCENYQASFRGLDAKDFPIIPEIKGPSLFKISAKSFKNALAQVVGMAAFSESRPEISGVLLGFDKKDLKLVATDSFRLAEKIIPLANQPSIKRQIIVPQRTIQELIRILGEKLGQDLKVVIGDNQILFELEDVQIISRLIEGQYPDYQQIIPQEILVEVILNKEEFSNTIRLASIFSSRINDVKFMINPRKSSLEVLAVDPDIGSNRSKISAEIRIAKGKTVQPLEINFNYLYILEGLANLESKRVILGLNQETSPAVLKPSGQTGYLYVVMPIKAT